MLQLSNLQLPSQTVTFITYNYRSLRLATRKQLVGSKLLHQLLEVQQELEEANRILQYEDEAAIEGNVAKQARQQLQDLRLCR